MSPEFPFAAEPSEGFDPALEQRMADLAAFARGVVHELRNPLNVIIANVYLLRERLAEDGARTARPVERIAEQVRAVEGLLQGYLLMEQADAPARQRVRLNDVVHQVVESLTAAEAGLVDLQLEDELPLLDADPRLLEGVLRALLRNALRATGHEGRIRVCTAERPGSQLLVVQDTGSGIDQEHLPRVFDPFFSTWEEHAGLGLPLAAKVARAHGGRVVLRTRPGAGTQVTLELPSNPRPTASV